RHGGEAAVVVVTVEEMKMKVVVWWR
nr:hypothetical protein [Tanacetum cinerariifolium]